METLLVKNFKAIQIESPVDKIISQIRQMIISGELKPGDRLPAERALSEMFQIGRSYVREAIHKLEFYGLLKTNPQSGTYVTGIGIKMLDTLISDIISFNKDDFNSLLEARYYLELTTVKLAAENRTEKDLHEMKKAALEFEQKVKMTGKAIEEDMMLHVTIARATKNPFLESMILVLIPDLIQNIVDNNVCGKNRSKKSIPQHVAILKAIEEQDTQAAEKAMAEHLADLLAVSKNNLEVRKSISQ